MERQQRKNVNKPNNYRYPHKLKHANAHNWLAAATDVGQEQQLLNLCYKSLRTENSSLKQNVTKCQCKAKMDEMAKEIESLRLRLPIQVSPTTQNGPAVQTDTTESPKPEYISSPIDIQINSTPLTDSAVQTDISTKSPEPKLPCSISKATSKPNITAKKRRSSRKGKDISPLFHLDTEKEVPFHDLKNLPSTNQPASHITKNLGSDFSLPPPLKPPLVQNSSFQALPTAKNMSFSQRARLKDQYPQEFPPPHTINEMRHSSAPSHAQVSSLPFSAPAHPSPQKKSSTPSAPFSLPSNNLSSAPVFESRNSATNFSKVQKVIIYGDSNYWTDTRDLMQIIKWKNPDAASIKYDIKHVKSYTLERTYELVKTNNHTGAIVIINVMTNNARRRNKLSHVWDLQETLILMLKQETSSQNIVMVECPVATAFQTAHYNMQTMDLCKIHQANFQPTYIKMFHLRKDGYHVLDGYQHWVAKTVADAILKASSDWSLLNQPTLSSINHNPRLTSSLHSNTNPSRI